MILTREHGKTCHSRAGRASVCIVIRARTGTNHTDNPITRQKPLHQPNSTDTQEHQNCNSHHPQESSWSSGWTNTYSAIWFPFLPTHLHSITIQRLANLPNTLSCRTARTHHKLEGLSFQSTERTLEGCSGEVLWERISQDSLDTDLANRKQRGTPSLGTEWPLGQSTCSSMTEEQRFSFL